MSKDKIYFDDIDTLDGWESPIEIIYKEVENKFLEDVDNSIQYAIEGELGAKIDREELARAMQYDRDQYKKGFKNGYRKCSEEIIRCEDCKHFHETRLGNFCLKHTTLIHKVYVEPDDFCSYGERKESEWKKN